MKLRCPECGNTRKFMARQAVRGDVSTEDLDFDDPEGPFSCIVCDCENLVDDDGRG